MRPVVDEHERMSSSFLNEPKNVSYVDRIPRAKVRFINYLCAKHFILHLLSDNIIHGLSSNLMNFRESDGKP